MEENHVAVVVRIVVAEEHNQRCTVDVNVVGLEEPGELVGPVALGRHDRCHVRAVSLAQVQIRPAVGGGKADVSPDDLLPIDKHGGVGRRINRIHGPVPIEIGPGDNPLHSGQRDGATALAAHPSHPRHREIGVEIRLHKHNIIGPDLSRLP